MTSPVAPARRYRPLLVTAAAASVALALVGCAATAPDEAGRSVDTALGSVVMPAEIDSVVVLEGRRDLDIVLSLGLPLVGFPYEGPDSGLDLDAPLAAATAAAVADGAEPLFLADEINLETIAEAAPSIIVSRIDDIEPIEDELRELAPLLPVRSHDEGVTWQEDLLAIADATGTLDRANELIAAYDARVAQIAETYAEQIATTSVVAIGYDLETTEVQASRLQSVVLSDLGALKSQSFLDAEAAGGEGMEYSPERTLAAHGDADAILVLADTADEWAAAQKDALWLQLPAVAAGNVVRSDKMTHEGGPITAMHVLDLLEELYETV